MIKRRALAQLMTCSSSGAAQVKDPNAATGGCLVLGTPVLSFNSSMANVYDIPFSMQFALTEVEGYADITTIADRFKITNVNIVVHGYNVSTVTSGLTYAPVPWLECISDYDDAVAPTIAAFQQKMGIKTKGFSQKGMLSFNVKPKVKLYTTDGYTIVPAKSQWVDSSTAQQPHFAVKGVIRNVNLSNTQACGYQFIPTYTVMTKDLQ